MPSQRPQCLIIAGEKSGEEHALSFLPELMQKYPHWHFFGVGGKAFSDLGVEIIYNLQDFSGIGLVEVIKKIPFYKKAQQRLLDEVVQRQVRYAILIDFQTFNLSLAQKCKKLGVEVFYYVAPQAWVWKAYRTKILEQCVHTLFTILPFEKPWFTARGVTKVISVPHPLWQLYHQRIPPLEPVSEVRHILILPGSRNSEVAKLLPLFLQTSLILQKRYPAFRFRLVKTESVNEDIYQNILKTNDAFVSLIEKFYPAEELSEALKWAHLSLAASGTVTLATGLFSVPTVVCYKMNFLTYYIFKWLIAYKGYVSLTNIIHQDRLFPELIQGEANIKNIVSYIEELLSDHYKKYKELRLKLFQTQFMLEGEQKNTAEYLGKIMNHGMIPYEKN